LEAVQDEGSLAADPQKVLRGQNLLDLVPPCEEGEGATRPTSLRRVAVAGQTGLQGDRSFSSKRTQEGGSLKAGDTDRGLGFACKKGLKPESPNQDDFSVVECGDADGLALYAVFDGHGPHGHNVSNFVQGALVELFLRQAVKEESLEKALEVAFLQTSSRVRECHQQHFDATASGTTVTVVTTRGNSLCTAHVGDSRAVAGIRTAGGKLVAKALTADHKPEVEAEKRRIEAAGGEVKRLEGDIPHRVFKAGCPFPGLAMSRAMGDLLAQECGVVDTPEVNSYTIDSEMRVALVCSDGVWEFITDEEAIAVVEKHGPGGGQGAVDELSQMSWDRWIAEEGDVVDDITAICVWLHGHS